MIMIIIIINITIITMIIVTLKYYCITIQTGLKFSPMRRLLSLRLDAFAKLALLCAPLCARLVVCKFMSMCVCVCVSLCVYVRVSKFKSPVCVCVRAVGLARALNLYAISWAKWMGRL